MKNRIASALLALSLALALMPAADASASLSNISKIRAYTGGFSDVSEDAWYYDAVSAAYEYAVLDGKDSEVFDPQGKLTLAEAIKLAVTIQKGYFGDNSPLQQDDTWYLSYVRHAISNGVISSEYTNYEAPATRADFAVIMNGALPREALTPVNVIDDGAISDVFESYNYGEAVYTLYRAGILTGCDEFGTFYPGRTITRAEAAAVVVRMLEADSRIELSLYGTLPGEMIYKNASPAVFYIEVFDEDETAMRTGSGFFITETGLAATNYHVMNGAVTAEITTADGETFPVTGIYDYDWKKDIALIQIEGDDFPFIKLADSDTLKTGQTVYALGSPLGLQASFSKGILSSSARVIEGVDYIQTDTPISPGSSGGVLLNSAGYAVGITAANMTGGQNLNLAVPINLLDGLSREQSHSLGSILGDTVYYEDHYPVPDFGAYSDSKEIPATSTQPNVFSYRQADLPEDPDVVIDGYRELLEQNFFSYVGNTTVDGNSFFVYTNAKHNKMVMLGKNTVGTRKCVTIRITDT